MQSQLLREIHWSNGLSPQPDRLKIKTKVIECFTSHNTVSFPSPHTNLYIHLLTFISLSPSVTLLLLLLVFTCSSNRISILLSQCLHNLALFPYEIIFPYTIGSQTFAALEAHVRLHKIHIPGSHSQSFWFTKSRGGCNHLPQLA